MRKKIQKTEEFRVCAIKECDMPKASKGLCYTHYQQIHRGYSLKPIGWRTDSSATANRTRACKHPGCNKPGHSRGLCLSHYAMVYQAFRSRTGDARCITPECNQAAMSKGLCTAHSYVLKMNKIAAQHPDVVEAMTDYRVEQGLSESSDENEA